MLQLSFVNFTQNSYILIEGTPSADRFFIIQTGKAQSYHETPVPGLAPALLGPGDFIGVVPCMSGHTQTESVVALTNVTAIMVRREQYPELIANNAPVAMKIVRAFTKQLRVLNDNLTKLTIKKSAVESPENLFSIAEYYEDMGMLDIAVYAYYQYLKEVPQGKSYDTASKRFGALRKQCRNAVYFEPSEDSVRQYPKDTMIFAEYQHGQDMFIIQEGSVKIVRIVNGAEVTLVLLKKGDMFGEMALLDNGLRSASAIAYENCKLLVVNRANFNMMVSTQPQYVAKLTTVFSDRLWSMYRQIVNTQLKDTRARMIDMIALQLENRRISVEKGASYHADFSALDIMELCGIPQKDQRLALMQLQTDQHVKVNNGSLIIPDVPELIKQATFYRKQNSKRQNEQ
ncbi:MAG: cyclic nucleotide-binding domain-containing protein [Treponema sp.]|nr:cyclic nucleotide-binding domain-containing protein [Treponema sp.]